MKKKKVDKIDEYSRLLTTLSVSNNIPPTIHKNHDDPGILKNSPKLTYVVTPLIRVDTFHDDTGVLSCLIKNFFPLEEQRKSSSGSYERQRNRSNY